MREKDPLEARRSSGPPDEHAKSVAARLPVLRGEAPDLVPARMLNEVTYCERLLHLEWAQGEWADNHFTVEGRYVHRRADEPGGKLPPVPAEGEQRKDAGKTEEERPYQARSVWLSSERLGITAKIDIVEGEAAGLVLPIEYKRGEAPDVPEGAYPPERVQVCAQVLLLREHGYACDEGALYFAGSRRRVTLVIDDALVSQTLAAVERARAVVASPDMPPPLVDSPRCNGCSLAGICLPDETNLLLGAARAAEDAPDEDRVRRFVPARDDALPLYVQEQGARVGLDGDRLAVRTKTATTHARLPNTSQVAILGNAQISTQAMRALCEYDIPVSFFSYGGWFYGRLGAHGSKNIDLRIAQHAAAADTAFCLRIARAIVAAKARNQRTLLRRNHEAPSAVALSSIEQLAKKAEQAESLGELLGLEGSAARVYFAEWSGMLKGDAERLGVFDLDGRNRRPPRDPVNALLSFVYALLVKDCQHALVAVGLEPLLGFYHQPRFGRPALALDLMEELRPLVADSVVLSVINTGVVGPGDFLVRPGAAALKPNARRAVLQAYERRMDHLLSHPVFGYRVSYRRTIEVQARLLARVITRDIDEYPPLRTR